jgi:hypothetical protein
MFDAVTGVQIPDNYGCIMADEMVFYIYFKCNTRLNAYET